MVSYEKTIKGLEECLSASCRGFKPGIYCPLPDEAWNYIRDAITLLKASQAFKSYFDDLYGQGLEISNWHMNGDTEPFDNFYDSAMEEYENAERE